MMELRNLKDNEILSLLLTGDFKTYNTYEDLVFIFEKYKYFFKREIDKNIVLREKIDLLTNNQIKADENMKNVVNSLNLKNSDLENQLYFMINRKLTWGERLSGKINKKLNFKL